MKVLYNLTNAWNFRRLACYGLAFAILTCAKLMVCSSPVCNGVHGCDDAACYISLLINQPVLSVCLVYNWYLSQLSRAAVCSWLENEEAFCNQSNR